MPNEVSEVKASIIPDEVMPVADVRQQKVELEKTEEVLTTKITSIEELEFDINACKVQIAGHSSRLATLELELEAAKKLLGQ